MIALLQRVLQASVSIDDETIASIDEGVLAFIAVQKQDDKACTDRMCERVLGYRMFADQAGRMNKSVVEVGGGILLVPQFTLAANTRKGLRPSFSCAASPQQGAALFAYFLTKLSAKYATVRVGKFGADMQIHLINDGPVTFWLEI